MINWLFYGIAFTIVISYLFECILFNKLNSKKTVVDHFTELDYISDKYRFCNKNNYLPLFNEMTPASTCNTMCGPTFKTFNVDKTHSIFREGKIFNPGRYCFHKSINQCNLLSSVAYISKATPNISCYPQDILTNPGKHVTKSLCHLKSLTEKENEKNILWDFENGVPATTIQSQSTLPNGQLKYRCKCGGTTRSGAPLLTLNEFPFHCFEDYCKNKTNSASFFDVTSNTCVCDSNTNNRYFFDKSSPCYDCVWKKLSKSKLQVSLECHRQENSYKHLKKVSCGEDTLFDISNNNKLGCLQGILDISIF